MKTKQIISIVVTGVVIIAVGITGVASNVISSKLIQKNKADTSSIVKEILSSETGSNIDLPEKDFVGVINIEALRKQYRGQLELLFFRSLCHQMY